MIQINFHLLTGLTHNASGFTQHENVT